MDPSAVPNDSSAGCGGSDGANEIEPCDPPKLIEGIEAPNPRPSGGELKPFGLWFVFPYGELNAPNVVGALSPVHTLPSLEPKDSTVSVGCQPGGVDKLTR